MHASLLFLLLGGCSDDPKLHHLRSEPEVEILSPSEGEIFRQGDRSVVMLGAATDAFDQAADMKAKWTLDDATPVILELDENSQATFEVASEQLELGTHTAVFEVTDSDGDVGTKQVNFEVQGPLGAPIVTILSPEDASQFDVGTEIAFQGEATDNTTPAADLHFVWRSSLQGELSGAVSGDGASILIRSDLQAGTHQISLEATDADGEVGSASITLTIEEEIIVADPGDLVFSELMINPEFVDDEVGEWVELYNTAGGSIDIGGYTFRDDDVDTWQLEGSIVVAAHDYVVLCANVDAAINGGIPCDAGFHRSSLGDGMALANGPDEVVLARPDGTEIDWLHYDDAWITSGVAIGVDYNYQESGANDDLSHWCLQVSLMSNGEPGTPGDPNDSCEL